jgi:tetratricopeptide (TPR) repeat protein
MLGRMTTTLLLFAALLAVPTDGKGWYDQALARYQSKEYAASAEAFDEVQKRGYQVPGWALSAAKSYARAGRSDDALKIIETLAANRQKKLDEVRSEPAFESLRADPRYQKALVQLERNMNPCPGLKDFAFWVGEWDVKSPDGAALLGTSSVTKQLDGCILLEKWKGGLEGWSFNILDPRSGHWRQTWVDATGDLHEYTGDVVGGAMVYRWDHVDNGVATKTRMVFSKLADGVVRQLIEDSTDGGATWVVSFDGRYHRRS